jgi:hypothetical protein
MTVGGWPLTGKRHPGDDRSFAYRNCFCGRVGSWNVIRAFSTERSSRARRRGSQAEDRSADGEQDALAEALREAPADSFPQIAALSTELLSGTGPDRLTWGFRVLISGIIQTPGRRNLNHEGIRNHQAPDRRPPGAGPGDTRSRH